MTRTFTYMTQEGFDAITKEYEELQSNRPEFVKKLTQAADMGDRSENAAYSFAKRKLRSTDSRLRFLKKVIDHTKVSVPKQTEYIEIGSHVTVKLNDAEHILGTFHRVLLVPVESISHIRILQLFSLQHSMILLSNAGVAFHWAFLQRDLTVIRILGKLHFLG